MNKKFPFLYFLIGWGLVISGFLDALYLSISHYRVYTDIEYSSFCAISKSINCDTVSQSSFSILFGVPVPVWGVVGYFLLILIFLFLFHKKNNERRLWVFFFVIVSFYSLTSLILALITIFYIHSYCLMCIISYAINFSLFFYAYVGIKKAGNRGVLKGLARDFLYLRSNTSPLYLLIKLFIAVIIVLWVVFPKYWMIEIKTDEPNLPSGVTEEGSHWIGALDPEVTIVEYTDYLCFQCKKMHFYLRSLVAENPDKIRLVHRHFPLDMKFNIAIKEDLHPGAGKMAMLAIYAGLKNRFWEMNDLLFKMDHSSGTINLKKIAAKTNLEFEELAWALEQKTIRLYLKRDIAMGAKAGVTGTPAYCIEDKLYLGTIPSNLITIMK